MSAYVYKEAVPELWPDFERLFGTNGACGGCWCQHWRVPKGGKTWELIKGSPAKQAMKELFTSGEITGLLAFKNRVPVGWCSFGPRIGFPRTETVKAYRRDDIDNVWSINCFFIDKNHRNKGLSRKILKATLRFLKKRKVKRVEAYPVTETRDGRKLPPAFSWTGPLKIFKDEGFEIIQQLSISKPLVRKKL
jgi:GNAT superfamily N-acetyltransferase